ncbi:MAG: discoidin domain-containing protein [Luteolibacter sp.]
MQGLTSQITHHSDTLKVIGDGRRKSLSIDSVAFAGLEPLRTLIVSGLFSLLLLTNAFGIISPDVTLAWSPNAETNIGHYQLRYGTASGVYSSKVNTGFRTRTSVTGLQAGTTYYFAVCAYSVGGLQGPLSQEIAYTALPPANTLLNRAPDGWISSPSTGGTIYAGQSIDFTGDATDPNGNAVTYLWNFGSGIPASTAKNPGSVRFDTPGTYRVTFTATDSFGLADPQPASVTIQVLDPATTVIPRTGWKLEYVNSEETNGYAATRSFDGDPSTFWHTKFTAAKLPKPPHQIQINLGTVRNVNGFEYLPRQDNIVVGNIGGYQFYTSMNGKKWGKAAAIGSFSDSSLEKRVNFTSRRAKFIRLVSISPADGYTDCNVAEINILQGPPPNTPPVSSAFAVSTQKNKAVAIKLKGSDANLNPLSFQIVKAPASGTLSGTPPNLTYRPKKNFTGNVTFTYRVNDGTAKSKIATVTIKVKNAAASSAAAPEDTLVARSAAITPADLMPGAAKAAAQPVTTTTVIGGEKFLVLTVAKPAIPDGVSRTVQVSPNLLDWFSGKNHTTVLNDDENLLRVRDNVPIAPGKKRYIRLKTRPH